MCFWFDELSGQDRLVLHCLNIVFHEISARRVSEFVSWNPSTAETAGSESTQQEIVKREWYFVGLLGLYWFAAANCHHTSDEENSPNHYLKLKVTAIDKQSEAL